MESGCAGESSVGVDSMADADPPRLANESLRLDVGSPWHSAVIHGLSLEEFESRCRPGRKSPHFVVFEHDGIDSCHLQVLIADVHAIR